MIAVAIFGVAMAVRLLHLWFIHDAPIFDVLMGDARAYDAWAQRLAAGDWMGSEVFYQAPLYPYFLGALYSLVGRDLFVARIVQAVVGSASAVLLASAGTRLFSPRVGTLAGFGLALYAPAIFFDSLLQKSVLDVFFVCLTIWLMSRLLTSPMPMTPGLATPGLKPRRAVLPAWSAGASAPASRSLWFALGVALGGLSLTRENAIALVIVAVVWAMVTRLEPGPGSREPRTMEAQRMPAARARHWSFAPVAMLVAGLAVVLLPVAARNYAIGGGFYLTTSQFGPNLYIGNNAEADGTYMPLRTGRGAPEYERQDATALAERALQRPLTPAEISSYWTDRALAFVTGQPGAWLQLMARKVALLANTSEMLDTESQESYEDQSPILRALAVVGHFGILVPCAAIGLVAAWPGRRRLWPLYAMLVVYAASVVLFYVFARYRFPLVPFLVLFAAAGLVALPSMVRAASRPRRAVLGTALAALAVAVNWPMLSSVRMRAITETNLGTALHEAGQEDAAVGHYTTAIALQPDYAPAYNNLGVTLRAQGKVDAAIATYEQALAIRDDDPDVHYNLANALLEQNRADEAAAHLRVSLAAMPESAAAHNNLGMALAGKGQHAQAAAEFRGAIAAEPGSALAHRNLGNVLASMGRIDEALATLRQAAALDPTDAAASYDLGGVLLESGRFDEAAAQFRATLALDARHVEAMNNLGIALASRGRIREAVALFERALQIRPDFEDAKRNLAMARQARDE